MTGDRLRAYVYIAIAAACGGCAGNESGLLGSVGTVILQSGQPYEARYVSRTHPALSKAMPTNQLLWDAGHRNPFNHCYYSDNNGQLTAITLAGIFHAVSDIPEGTSQPLPKAVYRQTFGGLIAPEQLQRTNNEIDLFVDALLKKTGGDRQAALKLARQSEAHDADCSRRALTEIQTEVELIPQKLVMARDTHGKVVVLTTGIVETRKYGLAMNLMRSKRELLSNIIVAYEQAYAKLAPRRQVEIATYHPPPSLPQSTRTSRSQPSIPRDKLPEIEQARDDRKNGQPSAAPEQETTALTVPAAITPPAADQKATSLRGVDQEYKQSIELIRQACLLKAQVSQCT